MVGHPAQSNRMCYKLTQSNDMSIFGEGIVISQHVYDMSVAWIEHKLDKPEDTFVVLGLFIISMIIQKIQKK